MMATPPQLPNCTDNGGCSMGRAGFEFTEQNFAVPRHYHGMNGPTGLFRTACLAERSPEGSVPVRVTHPARPHRRGSRGFLPLPASFR